MTSANSLMTRFFVFVLISLLLTGVGTHAAEVTVFAAASLTDSLEEIVLDYKKQSEDKIIFNFGASSTLARQIEAGAPADIFFSADEAKMDRLERKGLIETETRESRLGNVLVIVVSSKNALRLNLPKDLADEQIKRIAFADTEAVPAGVYAKSWLQSIQLWPAIEAKVVPMENVRGALAAVESGNVEAGIVYKTDAAISKKVKVAYEVSVKDGPDISYPMALVVGAAHHEAARRFLNYLDSKEAGDIFKKYGFVVRD